MKKFLCAVAVATMMMSCGGASEAGDKAQDTTAAATEKVETPAAPEAPAVPAVAFEKTGNELLDAQLETVSKFVDEVKAAKTKEEKDAIVKKAEAQIEKWQADNEEAGSKIDPALLEKFQAEFEKLSLEMMKEVM